MKTGVRTFGDFMKAYPHTRSTHDRFNSCRVCKKGGDEVALWKYSVRHYLCDTCIEKRVNEVLPEVKRRERFSKRLDAGAPHMAKLIRMKEVCARTGLCRAAIYAYIREDRFPKSVKIGSQAVAWVESEVDAWIEQRVADRDTSAEPTARTRAQHRATYGRQP